MSSSIALVALVWAMWRRRVVLQSLMPLDHTLSFQRRVIRTVLLVITLVLMAVLSVISFESAKDSLNAEQGSVPATEHLLVMLDVSRSMFAGEEVSRLARSVDFLQEMLDEKSGVRVALMVFAGDARVVCPFTEDTLILKGFLDRTRQIAQTVPSGSDPERVLREGVRFLNRNRKSNCTQVVLVSDGEFHSGDVTTWFSEVETDFRLHTVMVGNAEGGGALVPQKYGKGFLMRDGQLVFSKSESETLVLLANVTGGSFIKQPLSGPLHSGEIDQRAGGGTGKKREVFKQTGIETFLMLLALCVFGLLWAMQIVSEERGIARRTVLVFTLIGVIFGAEQVNAGLSEEDSIKLWNVLMSDKKELRHLALRGEFEVVEERLRVVLCQPGVKSMTRAKWYAAYALACFAHVQQESQNQGLTLMEQVVWLRRADAALTESMSFNWNELPVLKALQKEVGQTLLRVKQWRHLQQMGQVRLAEMPRLLAACRGELAELVLKTPDASSERMLRMLSEVIEAWHWIDRTFCEDKKPVKGVRVENGRENMARLPPLSLLASQWQQLTVGGERQLVDDLTVALRVLETVTDACQKKAYEDALRRLHELSKWFSEPVGMFQKRRTSAIESGEYEHPAELAAEEAVSAGQVDMTEVSAVTEALRSLDTDDRVLDRRTLDRLLDRVAEGQRVLPESRPSGLRRTITGGADW